jgi:hypothetical protein
MKFRKINNTNNAVVGMISAILIIGLLVMVLGYVNYSYVPQWIENEEASHMDLVSNQFSQLKYALDIQSIVGDDTAITSPIQLSRNEIPFLDPYISFGTLNVNSDVLTLVIEDNTNTYYNFTTDSIKFSSQNIYFVNQDYIYEAGALILSQDDTSVMKGKPSIIITDYGKNFTISFINISGISSKTYAAGYGTYPISTKALNSNNNDYFIEDIEKLTIYTDYPNAWFNIFNDSLIYSGFNYSILPLDDTNKVIIEFNDTSGDGYDLILKEIEISTQVAWGLV